MSRAEFLRGDDCRCRRGRLPARSATLGGAEPKTVATVTAEDLATGKVIVIGKLGVPLTTMRTIRGTWQPPPRGEHPLKDASLLFHVTHVDGKPLDEPVDFHRALVNVSYPLPDDGKVNEAKDPVPEKGETWEIRGYETGRFQGRPAQFNEELNFPPSQLAVWHRPFVTTVEGILPKPAQPADRGNARPVKPTKR